MRHPQLHAALQAAARDAGRELAVRAEEGDEVPYELLEHGPGRRPVGSTPTLYSYKPLVGLYVERHADELARLPTVAEAAHTMVAAWGVEAYLESRGVARPPADPHERARLGVRLFLERVYEEAPDFVLREEQFDRAFGELDAVLTVDATETVVAIPLVGVEIDLATVAITRGVALQRPDTLRAALPAAALAGPDGEEADAIATLRWAARPGSPDTPRRAREAARRLVTALRLHCAGAAPASGPLVWLRTAGGPWRAMALGGTFTNRGHVAIGADDVDDLQAFVELVARRLPERGEVAWALRRWTLALDRDRPDETLSDLLLAARALLEPEGPRSGRLAGRLAALVAADGERAALTSRLAGLAVAEEEIMAGRRRLPASLPAQVDELADCLRAVLRDCVCGHLEGDLVELAEDVLEGAIADEPVRPRSGDLRGRVLAAVRPLVGRAGGAADARRRGPGLPPVAPVRARSWDVVQEDADEDTFEDEVRDAITRTDDPVTETDDERDAPPTALRDPEPDVDEAPIADPTDAAPERPFVVVDRRGRGDGATAELEELPAAEDEEEGLFDVVRWSAADELDPEAADADADREAFDERWLEEVDREQLWLDQTWDDRALEEPRDDDVGPWPTSG